MQSSRRAEATVALEATPSSIFAFEDFVDGLAFLAPRERGRLRLAGGEILDNIVKHSSPVDQGRILARAVGTSGSILLGFYFRAPTFAGFAAEDARNAAPEPFFDPAYRRWRGIGLVMCRNLARRVRLRPGELMDRIFLEFDRDARERDRANR
jgi:hypothetical protein